MQAVCAEFSLVLGTLVQGMMLQHPLSLWVAQRSPQARHAGSCVLSHNSHACFDAFSGVSTLPGCPVKARRGARKEARKVAKGCEVALYRVCKRTVPSLGLLIDESDAAVKPQSVVCGFGLVFP